MISVNSLRRRLPKSRKMMVIAASVYLDMDGSSGVAGTISTSTSLNLAAGTYTLSFDLAGNQRSNAAESVAVTLGAFSETFSLNRMDPFTTYTRTFTVSDGTYNLSFAGSGGGDNVGMLLDNVNVSVVPVPGAFLLGSLGLGFAAWRLKRRKTA